MKTYGPVTFTINTLFRVGIDNTATAIQVHNNSGLSLRLYFGAAAPSSSQDAAHWHATISPGSHPVLPVRTNSDTPGTLTFLPFSEQGSPVQTPGIISASNIITIEAYFEGEDLPQSVYSPVFQQGAAQQRVITVPIPTAGTNTAFFIQYNNASASPFSIANSLMPPNCPAIQRQAAGGTFVCSVYMHDMDFRLESNNAAYNFLFFRLEAVIFRLPLPMTTLRAGPITMYQSIIGFNSPNTASERIVWSRPNPNPTFLVAASAVDPAQDLIGVRLVVAGAGGAWNLYPNLGWSFDVTNALPLSFYGANSATSTGPSPTNATNPNTF